METSMRVSFSGGKRADAEYKGFTIKTDQPVYQGGDGSAPAPFDLFLASIATCAAVYVLSFLQSRNIPTDQAGVRMVTARNPETKMIDVITLHLELPAGFPEKYREAVLKAVDICAVKKHIQNPPRFETRIEIGR